MSSSNKRSSKEEGGSLLRLLEILEGIAQADRPQSATDLNEVLRYPKATIHRLCGVLEREGFLERQLDGKRLVPGPRLATFVQGVLSQERFRIPRHAILKRLSEEIGETCNIALPRGSEMIYFDRVQTHWPLQMQLPVGSEVPLYCTSAGKIYLSSLSRKRRTLVVQRLTLEPHTPQTITDSAVLEQELEIISKQGYSTDKEEFIEGMVCVGVPISDERNRLFATLSFHAPTSRMSLSEATTFVPTLQDAAEQLAQLPALD